MLTLENIGLNNEDENEVIIHFSYEGERVDFKGQMKLTPEEFMASRHKGDGYMAELILQRELNWWINS